MRIQINGNRKHDARERCRKLTLTATDDVEEVELAAIAYAIAPISKRDKAFDRWLVSKIAAYCKKNNLVITKAKK